MKFTNIIYRQTFVFFLQIIGLVSSNNDVGDLILLQTLWRHGDRSPVTNFPKNPQNQTVWPQGWGQLSQKGMEQQYQLGQYLRARYINGNPWKLLSEMYSRYEVTINSTDYDRTLMSAYSNLAGLFPPQGRQVWNQNLTWQPIPVHTKPLEMDHVLYTDNKCSAFDKHYHDAMHSDMIKKEEKENAEFYTFLSQETGVADEGIAKVWEIYDTLFCESQHDLHLPSWATNYWKNSTQSVMQKMSGLESLQFDVKFDHPVQSRLTGGPLLKTMIENMQAKINGSTKQKAFLYSAHDSTVAALLSAAKVFNKLMPPYASAVLVELYNKSGSYSVQMLYRNDSSHDPYPLIVPGCEAVCPLDKFINLTKDNIPVDWASECDGGSPVPSPSPSARTATGLQMEYIIIICSVAGVIFLALVIVVSLLVYRRRCGNRFTPYYGLETPT